MSARVGDDSDVEEITQEALARAWEARWRLDRTALAGYAIVTARHLVTSRDRREAVRDKYAARLADSSAAAPAEEEVLSREEHEALATALGHLDEKDRSALVAHEVDDRSVLDLAGEHGTTAGAMTARLARARARLRVEYLLAFRRTTLPTPLCWPVLLALSSGDRRRQRALGAAEHLVECSSCADLSRPLLTRKRSLAGLVPLLGWLADRLRWRGNAPRAATTAAAVVAAAGVVATAFVLRDPLLDTAAPEASPTMPARAAPAARPPAASLTIERTVVLPAPSVGDLTRYVGRVAVATRAPVQSVPADEGFWVGWTERARVWVQLSSPGESPVTVRPGQLVTFTGSVVPHTADFPPAVGVTAAEGAAQLAAHGAHIVISDTGLER